MNKKTFSEYKNSRINKLFNDERKKQYHHEYLSAIAGARKTTYLCDYAAKEIKTTNARFIFALPSTELCDQVESTLTSLFSTDFCPVFNIHSKQAEFAWGTDLYEPVTKRIIERMKEINDNDLGGAIIITQAALRNMTGWPEKSEWIVVHDEAFSPLSHTELRLREHPRYITDVIKMPRKSIGEFFLADVKSIDAEVKAKINAVSSNVRDDQFWELLANFYADVENARDGKCEIFVNRDAWDGFNDADNLTANTFIATAVYGPKLFEGFKRVIFSGALFEYELLFHCWQDLYGVEWGVSDLTDKITIKSHDKQVRLHYVFDDLKNSKHLLNKVVGDKSVLEACNDIAKTLFSDDLVIHQTNKSNVGTIDNNFVHCPYANRGLNSFQHIKNVYYSGAYNMPPAYYNFVKWLGLETIHNISQPIGHFYQTIIRSAIRDSKYNGAVDIFTPCRSIFEPISGYFDNVEYVKVATDFSDSLEQPKTVQKIYEQSDDDKRLASTIRQARSRALNDLRTTLLVDSTNQKTKKGNNNSSKSSKTSIESSSYSDVTLLPYSTENCDKTSSPSLTFYASIFDRDGLESNPESAAIINYSSADKDAMFNSLKNMFDKVIRTKKDSILACPAVFKDKSAGRVRSNVSFCVALMLDYDTPEYARRKKVDENGDIVMETLKNGKRRVVYDYILDDEGNKIKLKGLDTQDIKKILGENTKFMIYSTFSGGNRRRVVTFLEQSLSADEYMILAKHIAKKSNELYPHHELDFSKLLPESLFYVPSRKEEIEWIFGVGDLDDKMIRKLDKTSFLTVSEGKEWLNGQSIISFCVNPPQTEGPTLRKTSEQVAKTDSEQLAKPTSEPTPRENRQEKQRLAEKREEKYYDTYIKPKLAVLCSGNYFAPAQHILPAVKDFCPSQQYRLFDDLAAAGMSQSQLNGFKKFYKDLKIKGYADNIANERKVVAAKSAEELKANINKR